MLTHNLELARPSHIARHEVQASIDLSVNGVYEHILGLQGLSHGLTNAFQGGQALLYIVQVQVLLLLGYLPVLHSTQSQIRSQPGSWL